MAGKQHGASKLLPEYTLTLLIQREGYCPISLAANGTISSHGLLSKWISTIDSCL